MIRFIWTTCLVPLLVAYSLLKQRSSSSCGHGSNILSVARSDKYSGRFRSDFCMRQDDRVGKVLLQEAGSRQSNSDQSRRQFGRSDLLSPKEDLSMKLLDRILKACRVIPKTKKTLNEVVQVSLFSLSEMNLAISVAGKEGRLKDAIAVFENIPTMGYQPDIKSFNNMIWAAGHCGQDDVAYRYYQDLLHSEQRFIPNVFTYSALMHAYARAKNAQKALQFLRTLLSMKEEVNLVVFGAAMNACAGAGQDRVSDAMWILDQVAAMGLTPDLALLNTAVKVCLAAGETAKANDIVKKIRSAGQMDIVTYHVLMKSCLATKHYATVLELFEEAHQTLARLDSGVYSLAISAAFEANHQSTVVELSAQAKADEVVLTEESFSRVMEAYLSMGMPHKALESLEDMKTNRRRPSASSYALAIDASRDDPSLAWKYFKEAQTTGQALSTGIFNSLFRTFSRHGEQYIRQSLEVLRVMEAHGPPPSAITYNSILHGLGENGRSHEAWVLVKERMIPRGIFPDVFSVSCLLHACARASRLTEAQTINQVQDIFSLMQEHRVVPDDAVFSAALEVYRRIGDAERAVRLLEVMKDLRMTPTAMHLNQVLLVLRDAAKIDGMISLLFETIQNDIMQINGNSFEIVLEGLLGENRWDKALGIALEMEQLGFQPSMQTCVALISSLEQHRQYRTALAVFSLMLKYDYDFNRDAQLNAVFKRMIFLASQEDGRNGPIVHSTPNTDKGSM